MKIAVSLSGGRSSAMMLKILIENYGAENIVAVFANTGKEIPETINFLRSIQKEWKIPIHIVEFKSLRKWVKDEVSQRECIGYELKTLDSLSMNGEPFMDMIQNIATPTKNATFCSSYLKVIPIELFLQNHSDIQKTAIGVRYDESSRWSFQKKREGAIFPLHELKVTIKERDLFWQSQPFKLEIDDYLGNCDLCIAKTISIKRKILHDNPSVGDWWREIEESQGINFEYNFTVKEILAQTKMKHKKMYNTVRQYDIFDEQIFTSGTACFCGD